MQTLSNSEIVKEEEIEDRSTGNERTDDNQQLRQLLVNGQVKRPPADSGIDTQSNSSETPICSSLPHPQPPPTIPGHPHVPHQPLQLPISSANLWPYNTAKPTVGYSPEHSMSVRTPGLDVVSSHQVSYPVFASPTQQPHPSGAGYVITEQTIGIPGTCQTGHEGTVCFASPVQNEIHFYEGYRHSIPPTHVYESPSIPRPDPSYIPGVAFTQTQAVYEVNNQLIPTSTNLQHLQYDPNVPISYTAHLAPPLPHQSLYTNEQNQFVSRIEPTLVNNVQTVHTRLPSLSLGQRETESCLQSPPFPQPIPIPDASENWTNGVDDQVDHKNPSMTSGRGSGMSGNPNGQIQLWSFILDELENADSQDVLCWTGDGWEFRFKDPEKVAKKWGEQKNKPSMNYEKMSRGLRYYYDKDIIRKSSSGGRYHYRFTDKKMRERTPFSPPEYFRHLGITPQREDAGK